ncbi:hypothetical protein KP509_14G007900 [Ceratopteris richardii]|nr:hypothetical protein KP509_14G007900 [Ceratopteris richardii]
MPVRPYGGAGYNNYGSNPYSMNSSYNNTYNGYNRGYGVGGSMYGTTGYGLGGSYGGGMYGNSYGGGMYGNGMYGGGMYGGGMNGGSMYGNGMYGGSYGFGPGGMGMGPMVGAGPSSNALGDPNNPFDGNNPGPPSFWQSTLQKMHWMMVVFGNIVSLIAENTQTFHVIATALYAFLDRSGMLAGFVLKLLRLWSRPRLQSKALGKPKNGGAMPIEGPKSAGNAWDNVWSGQSAG